MFNKYNFLIAKITKKEKKGGRANLRGVYVTPEATIATDSFRLLKVDGVMLNEDFPEIPNGKKPIKDFKPFIVPREEALEAATIVREESDTLPVLNNTVILSESEDFAEIAGMASMDNVKVLNVRKIKEEYPDVDSLFQEKNGYVEVAINAKFLKEMAEFFANFADGVGKEITLKIPSTSHDPVRFEAKRMSGQKAVGLLMLINKK